MVVANVQPQSAQFVPKRSTAQRNDGKQSFESLMNEKISKAEDLKAAASKNEAPSKAMEGKEEQPKKDTEIGENTQGQKPDSKATDKAKDEQSALDAAMQMQAKASGIIGEKQGQIMDDTAQSLADAVAKNGEIAGDSIAAIAQGQTQEGILAAANNKQQLAAQRQGMAGGENSGGKKAEGMTFQESVHGAVDSNSTKADNGILESKAAKDTAQAMWDKATADTAQEMANKSHIQGQKNEKLLNETEPTQVNVMADQPVMNTLNPDNINIKVGEAVDTTSENFAKDFSDKIVYKLNQDIKEFQIELNPQGMGKVSIKVEFVANKAFVSLSCENAKTQTLLAQSSDTIRSIIQQNVGSETVVVIHEENQPQQYQQSQQQNEQSQQEQHHEGAKQKPSDDSITFVNQLRLGLVDVTKQ